MHYKQVNKIAVALANNMICVLILDWETKNQIQFFFEQYKYFTS